MANGRLKRESNPIPGEIPGFLPQHESSVSGEFVVTGENNPYPTKVKNIHEITQRLDSLEEKIDKILDGTQPANVQLTGSMVELAKVSNAIIITPGSSLLLLDGENLLNKGVKTVRAAFRPKNNGVLKVSYTSKVAENTINHLENVTTTLNGAQSADTINYEVYSNHITLSVSNWDKVNQELLRAYVLGVK